MPRHRSTKSTKQIGQHSSWSGELKANTFFSLVLERGIGENKCQYWYYDEMNYSLLKPSIVHDQMKLLHWIFHKGAHICDSKFQGDVRHPVRTCNISLVEHVGVCTNLQIESVRDMFFVNLTINQQPKAKVRESSHEALKVFIFEL